MDNWKVNNETAVFANANPSVENIQTKNSKNKLLFIIGGAVLGLALIIFLIVFFILPKKTDLVVLVAPETAEISIDGKTYKNGKRHYYSRF